MKVPMNIRQSLGLSQKQLATFLSGDRVLLYKVEAGARQSTSDALLKLLTLEESQPTTSPASPPLVMESALIKQLHFHARVCRTKCDSLKKKLQTIEVSYGQARRLLHFLEQLSEANDINLSIRQKRWMEEQRNQAIRKMKYCDHNIQKKLSLTIQALEAEALLYESEAVA